MSEYPLFKNFYLLQNCISKIILLLSNPYYWVLLVTIFLTVHYGRIVNADMNTHRVKSSSSSLFCRVCLGWAIFAQLGSDWSRRLMSSSLDQEALMVSFSSHWTIALRQCADRHYNAEKATVYLCFHQTYSIKDDVHGMEIRWLKCYTLLLLRSDEMHAKQVYLMCV